MITPRDKLIQEFRNKVTNIRKRNITNPCSECLVRACCSVKRIIIRQPLSAELTGTDIMIALSCKQLNLFLAYRQLEAIKPDDILEKDKYGLNLLDHVIKRVERNIRTIENG